LIPVIANTDGITDCSAGTYTTKYAFMKLNQKLSYRIVDVPLPKRVQFCAFIKHIP
jgi:hypothetical protein